MNEEQKPPVNYQKWFIELCQDMLDMRDAQKNYFAQPTEYKLKVAKVKEAKVDNWLERMKTAKLIKHKPKPADNQAKMF